MLALIAGLMALDVPDLSNPLVRELYDSFLEGGHTESEWNELSMRPSLPAWALTWITVDDEGHGKKLSTAVNVHMDPYTFLEVEVTDDGGRVTGRAVLCVQEAKTTNSQFSARVYFVASNDPQFEDWAKLHFDDLKDFEVHFCKKSSGACTVKPRSKNLGWFHVSVFKFLAPMACMNIEYAREGAIQLFSSHLQFYMDQKLAGAVEEKGKKASPQREVVPSPRRHGDDSDEEDKRRRAEEKRMPLDKGTGGYPGRRGRERTPPGRGEGNRRGEGDAGDTRGVAAAKAREAALAASRALNRREPEMVDPPRVDLRARLESAKLRSRYDPPEDRREGGRSFLDDISAIGEDDPMVRGSENGERKRKRSSSGGRNRRRKDDDDGKKRDKDNKRKRSPSDRKDPPRGSKVVALTKEEIKEKKQKKKGKGGPSSDPSSSSSGGGRKDKKKKGRKGSSSGDEKGKKKRRKEKKKKKSSSSRSSRSLDSQEDLYGKETAKYESLVEKARRHPGRLLRSGLEQMNKFLAARSGAEGSASMSWRDQRVGAYLHQVLFNQHPQHVIGVRNSRELVTLAEAIDLLMEERLASLGDLLMQRMKAVEASLTEGWGVANFQEPPPRSTLTTDQETAFAARHAIQQRRLQDTTRKKSN